VANIGIRPTVDGASGRLLEVHLLDFSGDCYGVDMEVRFDQFLRPEKKFESVGALKAQIGRDVECARHWA
jgi:riboflavin kinase/FMN adenylyltransferase